MTSTRKGVESLEICHVLVDIFKQYKYWSFSRMEVEGGG